MNNGFYFNTEQISADYFLLKKMHLIMQNAMVSGDDKSTPDRLFHFNGKNFTFSSLFDYQVSSDLITIFNYLQLDELITLKQQMVQNPNQKVLFVAHILFDYQKVLRTVCETLGFDRVIVLVENDKDPYIVSESDILKFEPQMISAQNILVYKKKSVPQKIKSPSRITLFLKHLFYFILKLFLKPKQFINDFFATYNARYFYGKIKVPVVKLYFGIRHTSVMSLIRFFYGIKVFGIRSTYWLSEKIKFFSLALFFKIRHFSVMSMIHFFYGLKATAIRSFYWVLEVIKLGPVKIYFMIRHLVVMGWVRSFYGLKVMAIRAFYGVLEVFKLGPVKIYFMIRHLVVMGWVRSFYGLKVMAIRAFYGVLEVFKLGPVKIYFTIRHLVVMGWVRSFYGLKVIAIRSFYWLVEAVSLYPMRIFFKVRHSVVMGCIRGFYSLKQVTLWPVQLYYRRRHIGRLLANHLIRAGNFIYYQIFCRIRHLVVMGWVRSFYGLKVIAIRAFYGILEVFKLGPVKIYFMIRHLVVMGWVRSFYGLKVMAIRAFYGILEVFKLGPVKIYFTIRHLVVMGWVRSFYGLKVMAIRAFYGILEVFKLGPVKIYFTIRHLVVMGWVRSFYGLKVMAIRAFYGVLEVFKLGPLIFYYRVRHSLVMVRIKAVAFVYYLRGFLIWCYYRLEWLFYRTYEFNMRYTLYPFRKLFWFVNFQVQKRILNKVI